ncbi:MAG TPA: hypothetical protein VH482_18150 [Thermomicrobiales bacterium]|jgi:hypothetical protein
MGEHYDTLLVAWLFILIIGGWLLVNALVDLGARRLREWLFGRGVGPRGRWFGRGRPPTAAKEHRDTPPRLPLA